MRARTGVIAAGDFLDLDDICAEVPKQHGRGRASEHAGEVEDFDALERGRHARGVTGA